MWAVIKKSNNEVIGYTVRLNDQSEKEAKINNLYFIKMTLENSPAHVGGFWDGSSFSEPKE